ncbi:LysR family transcriptional regulator [Lacticaseibacillus pantheris]
MDIRKLRTFVNLAHTLNYTETAAALFTTQATVSKHIISMEKELETQLFIRAHRTIELTPAGNTVLKYAREILTSYDEMARQLSTDRNTANQTLTIRAIPSVSNYRALGLITEFQRANPDIELHFTEGESYALLPSLDDGHSDIVFMRTFVEHQTEYDMITGEVDRFVAVVPDTSTLAHQSHINVSQLRGQNFLMLGKETNLFEPIMRMARAADFTPTITYEGQRIDLVLQLVNKGMGVSIMMEKTVRTDDYPHIVKIPLDTDVSSHLAFVRRHEGPHTQASDRFWRYAQAHRDSYAE